MYRVVIVDDEPLMARSINVQTIAQKLGGVSP